MKIPKSEVLKLLNSDVGYTDQDMYFANIRGGVQSFYSRLNDINVGRQDFYEKISVPKSGVLAKDLTTYDFLNAFSRLIYGNNVCVAMSFFKGEILLATNKDDYNGNIDDVILSGFRDNYNHVCSYVRSIAKFSSTANQPLWVDNKFVTLSSSSNYDQLAANLASVIVYAFANHRQKADIQQQLSEIIQKRGGEAKTLLSLIDDTKDFESELENVMATVEYAFGTNSAEDKMCLDFVPQYCLENELQSLKEFAKYILDNFFTYKTSYYSGDLVMSWKQAFKCPPEYTKMYKDVLDEIKAFLKDLLIVEAFVSYHPGDELVQAFVNQETVVHVLDDNGDALSSRELLYGHNRSATLEIDGIRPGDVHAEQKILQYQLKNGGALSLVAISKLCCAFCHLVFEAVDQSGECHYPGYHGASYKLRLSDWIKDNNLRFLKQILGDDAFASFEYVKDSNRMLGSNQVNGGALLLLLIEVMPELAKAEGMSLDFVKIPKGTTPFSANNKFAIDFGITPDSLTHKYFSCKNRSFIDQSDGSACKLTFINHNLGIRTAKDLLRTILERQYTLYPYEDSSLVDAVVHQLGSNIDDVNQKLTECIQVGQKSGKYLLSLTREWSGEPQALADVLQLNIDVIEIVSGKQHTTHIYGNNVPRDQEPTAIGYLGNMQFVGLMPISDQVDNNVMSIDCKALEQFDELSIPVQYYQLFNSFDEWNL